MPIKVNGQNVRLAEPSPQDSFEIEGDSTAQYRLTELDQADPAGRYRFLATGDTAVVQRAATAQWATATDLLTFSATAVTVPDGILLRVGSDGDGVLVNVAAGLAANTSLVGVLAGTVVASASAANSLYVTNITASGDIIIAANRGGNSESYLEIDSSAGQLTLNARGTGSIQWRTNGADRVAITSAGRFLVGRTTPAFGNFGGIEVSAPFGSLTLIATEPNGGTFTFASNTRNSARSLDVWDETGAAYRFTITNVGNVKIGDNTDLSALRGTTEGTKTFGLFDGVAPAGILSNGVSLYSSAGRFAFMNASNVAFIFPSPTANGTVATAMSSLGPVGSNTTIQEWLTVIIAGNTRYIPCF